jgi:hypothetical protein
MYDLPSVYIAKWSAAGRMCCEYIADLLASVAWKWDSSKVIRQVKLPPSISPNCADGRQDC